MVTMEGVSCISVSEVVRHFLNNVMDGRISVCVNAPNDVTQIHKNTLCSQQGSCK